MKTLLTAAALVAAAGFCLSAFAETTPTTAPGTKSATEQAAKTDATKPTTGTATTASTATGTTAMPTGQAGTTATKTTEPVITTQTFSGQITSLTPTTCKIKDATGKEQTFNLGGMKVEGVKVGDKVVAKFDPKTNNLVSWMKQ